MQSPSRVSSTEMHKSQEIGHKIKNSEQATGDEINEGVLGERTSDVAANEIKISKPFLMISLFHG